EVAVEDEAQQQQDDEAADPDLAAAETAEAAATGAPPVVLEIRTRPTGCPTHRETSRPRRKMLMLFEGAAAIRTALSLGFGGLRIPCPRLEAPVRDSAARSGRPPRSRRRSPSSAAPGSCGRPAGGWRGRR